MCDATHDKLFGSGQTAVNEVCRYLVYILDDIYIYIYIFVTMYIQYTVFGVKFLVPAKFLIKYFACFIFTL